MYMYVCIYIYVHSSTHGDSRIMTQETAGLQIPPGDAAFQDTAQLLHLQNQRGTGPCMERLGGKLLQEHVENA